MKHEHIIKSVISNIKRFFYVIIDYDIEQMFIQLDRINRGLEILLVVMGAEKNGLYASSEHLMSLIDLED